MSYKLRKPKQLTEEDVGKLREEGSLRGVDGDDSHLLVVVSIGGEDVYYRRKLGGKVYEFSPTGKREIIDSRDDFLPICSECGRIRVKEPQGWLDKGRLYSLLVRDYELSHTYCPDCRSRIEQS